MKNLIDYRLNYKGTILLLIVAYISYIVVNIYLHMELGDFLKKSLIIIICITFMKIVVSTSMEKVIVFLVLILPFPVFITFGKDLDTSTTLAIYLVFLVHAVRNMMKKQPVFLYKPFLLVLIYIVTCYILSLSNTPWFGRENALRMIAQFISCILIFYIIVNHIQSKREIIRIIDVITIMCFVESLIIIFQVLFPTKAGFVNFFSSRVIDVVEVYESQVKKGIRVYGTIASDYNLMSDFFAMNIIIQFYRVQSLKPSTKRKFYVLCMLFSGFAMVSLGTRSGILAFFAASLITLFISRHYVKVGKNIVLICVLLMVFLGFMFFIAENLPYVSNVFDRLTGTKFESGIPDTRVGVWKIVLPIIMEHPWIGWGPQNIAKSGIARYMNPHNLYLTYMFNIGIIGTLGVLYFFGAVFRSGISSFKKLRDHEITYAIGGLIGAFLVIVIGGFLIEYLRSGTLQQFVWIIFALIVAIAKFAINGEEENLNIISHK